MANRSYLYSTNNIPGAEANGKLVVKGLSECDGIIPLSYLLLASGDTQLCNSYVWDNLPGKIALIGDYESGMKNLQEFITMLSKSDISNSEGFKDKAERALSFLQDDSNKQKYILLEIAEIFMHDCTEDDAETIQTNAGMLAKAVRKNDIALINAIAGGNILKEWEELAGLDYWQSDLYFSPQA